MVLSRVNKKKVEWSLIMTKFILNYFVNQSNSKLVLWFFLSLIIFCIIMDYGIFCLVIATMFGRLCTPSLRKKSILICNLLWISNWSLSLIHWSKLLLFHWSSLEDIFFQIISLLVKSQWKNWFLTKSLKLNSGESAQYKDGCSLNNSRYCQQPKTPCTWLFKT